jgi:hypothetical protein
LYLLTCITCSYFFLWFPTSIFDKVWRNPIFLAENLAHGSQKKMTKNVNTFALISCQIFVVDHSKSSSFFTVKTCCKILLCNSIATVHYFWKTKILNLKNFVSLWPIFLHDAPLKSRISRSIFVSVARQPDKHVLKYHARKLRCHLGAHCPFTSTCQSQGAYGRIAC